MLPLILGFIEFIGAILVILSSKTQLSFWLAAVFAVLVLLLGIYSAVQRKLRAVVEIASAGLLVLQLVQFQVHPIIAIPVGILLFAISITNLLPIFLE